MRGGAEEVNVFDFGFGFEFTFLEDEEEARVEPRR